MTRDLRIRCRHCRGPWSAERLRVLHKRSCQRPGASSRPVQTPAWPLIVDMVARVRPDRESYLTFHPLHGESAGRTVIGGAS